MHTESTLRDLDNSLTRLGKDLRHFKKTTCAAFVTRDLPKEAAACGRRKAAMTMLAAQSKGKRRKAVREHAGSDPLEPKRSYKLRNFNFSTVKGHGLGDYVDTILEHGTTDNYSTQIVR